MAEQSHLMELADKVRNARECRKWSQEQAAKEAGIGTASWQRVEQAIQVRPSTLRVIATTLGLLPQELIALTFASTVRNISNVLEPEEERELALAGSESRTIRPMGQEDTDAKHIAPGIEAGLSDIESVWNPGNDGSIAESVSLPPELQRFYARLSATQGLVPIAAVAAICGEPNAVELLAQLHKYGLVGLETVYGEPSVRILARSEAEIVAQRHAAYFCNLAIQNWERRLEQAAPARHAQIAAFLPDIKRALEWYLTQGDPEMAMRFASALAARSVEGPTQIEFRQWLERALAQRGAEAPTQVRVQALMRLSSLTDFPQAEKLLKEALRICQRLDDKAAEAETQRRWAVIKRKQGNFVEARKRFEKSLALYEQIGDNGGFASACNSYANLECQEQNYSAGRRFYQKSAALHEAAGNWDLLAGVLENLGFLEFQGYQYERAREHYERSYKIREQWNLTSNYGHSLYNLADVLMYQGKYDESEQHFHLALKRLHPGDHRFKVAEALAGYGALVLRQGYPKRAARLFGAAQATMNSLSEKPPKFERIGYEMDVNAIRAALDRAEFEAEWQTGYTMTLNEARDFALSASPNDVSS